MNRQVSWKFVLPVIAAALGLCAFVYSRIPTGMVVHMTAKGPAGRRGGVSGLAGSMHRRAGQAAAKGTSARPAPAADKDKVKKLLAAIQQNPDQP